MFYRVVPTIIHVIFVIGLIADVVFPKPALPDAFLAPSDMTGTAKGG